MRKNITYLAEIARKTIHVSSLWVPLSYYYLTENTMLRVLGGIAFVTFLLDLLRVNYPPFYKIVNMFFGNILREHELKSKKITGASFFLLAFFTTVLLFPKNIAIISMCVLCISDSIASLVGRKVGRIKFFDKTLEGAMAFFVSGLAVSYYLNILLGANLSIISLCTAVFIGTLIELFSNKLGVDDNFSIPVVVGATLKLFSLF